MPLEQMRLRPEAGGPGIYLDIEVPVRLAEKLRALSLGQRLQVALRAPGAIENVVDQLAHVAELSNLELQQRFSAAQRDIESLAAERARRRQCRECGVHADNGHLFGCTLAVRE